MKRGAEIDVKWLDILDAPSDHPDRATLAVQYTRGFFWAWRTVARSGKRIRCLIMTLHRASEEDETVPSGYVTIPKHLITDLIERVD